MTVTLSPRCAAGRVGTAGLWRWSRCLSVVTGAWGFGVVWSQTDVGKTVSVYSDTVIRQLCKGSVAVVAQPPVAVVAQPPATLWPGPVQSQ